MKRRKKRSVPVMLLWSKREQLRFVEAVERLVSIVGDLEVMLASKKRQSEIARRAAATRAAQIAGTEAGVVAAGKEAVNGA